MKLYCVGCEIVSDEPELDLMGIQGTFKGICDNCKKVIQNIAKHNRIDLLKKHGGFSD